MNTELKLEEIEKLPSKNLSSQARILELCTDNDEDVRLRAVERLIDFKESEVTEAIVTARHDNDQFVRIAAFECIGYFGNLAHLNIVRSGLGDNNELIRRAAEDAAGQLGDQSLIKPLRIRLNDASDPEKVTVSGALYRLGDLNEISDLFQFLSSPSYHARCSVANLFLQFYEDGLIPDQMKDPIVQRLDAALKSEKTQAAQSSISEALKQLRS